MSRRQAVIVKSRKPHRFKGMSSTTRTRTHVWAENRTDDESIPEKFSVSRKIQFSVYARGAEFSESDDLLRIVFRVRFFDSSHIVSGIFLYFFFNFFVQAHDHKGSHSPATVTEWKLNYLCRIEMQMKNKTDGKASPCLHATCCTNGIRTRSFYFQFISLRFYSLF